MTEKIVITEKIKSNGILNLLFNLSGSSDHSVYNTVPMNRVGSVRHDPDQN